MYFVCFPKVSLLNFLDDMKHEVTVKPTTAYFFSLGVFAAAIIFFGGPFAWLWGGALVIHACKQFLSSYGWLALIIAAGTILHEALHGFTWAAFCRYGVKSIRYGINWSSLSPYAHCTEPLPLKGYRLGGVMPGIVVGILPAIVSIFVGSGWLLMTGIFFTAGAAGDFLILWKLLPYDSKTWIQDHPEKMGFIISSSEQ